MTHFSKNGPGDGSGKSPPPPLRQSNVAQIAAQAVGQLRAQCAHDQAVLHHTQEALERETAVRTRLEAEVGALREELALANRQASMAEVATGTLHNVGNVLTSINVVASVISARFRESRVVNLGKVLALLREHHADLATFLTADPKGKMLPAYLETLAEHLTAEHTEMAREMEHLNRNIEHVKEIVAMQQNYARLCGVSETLQVAELVQDAIRMNLGAFERHGVSVEQDFANVPPVTVDRHKVLQILVNLMRNAKYAMDEFGPHEKRLRVRIRSNAGKVLVIVTDNGIGIAPENLARVFSHGFTTKRDGHGFGLHSGLQAARELGGGLTAASDGPGTGATFCLELPAAKPPSAGGAFPGNVEPGHTAQW